jgi:hypothetical protein
MRVPEDWPEAAPRLMSRSVIPTPRDLVIERSGGRCEAMVLMSGTTWKKPRMIWARCFRSPVDVHHRLTRARGGGLLDELGEIYHLMALCRQHHSDDADGRFAFEAGLLLDGRMYYAGGVYWYEGSDPYLKDNYGNGVRTG